MIYTPLETIENGVLLIHDGRIKRLGSKSQVHVSKNLTKIDADQHIICPGFIDLQVNGGGGVLLTEDGSYDGVCAISEAHVSFGTTSILPTIMTAETTEICTALEAVYESVVKGTNGASVLGSHLEGPFINREKRGIHDARYIRKPSIRGFNTFLRSSHATLRILTLAPELKGALDLILHAKKCGVTVSLGHSNATYPQVLAAVKAGLSLATHVLNAMGRFGAREPGTVGAILSNEFVKASLIADGVHVHPASMRVVLNAKGIQNVFLVSDSMPPIGTSIKDFMLHRRKIHVKGRTCYSADGTIAGSTSSISDCVKIVHETVGVPLNYAIAMATEVPARAIGAFDTKGSLVVGKDADIVICDSNMRTIKTLVGGKILYEK